MAAFAVAAPLAGQASSPAVATQSSSRKAPMRRVAVASQAKSSFLGSPASSFMAGQSVQFVAAAPAPAQFFVAAETAAPTRQKDIGLAKKLKVGTAKSHNMAENVDFVKGFLNGLVEKTSYSKLVANLYHVYSAIEEEMERNKDHPMVAPIYFKELNRKEALEQDLQFYFGANWREQAVASAAGQAYVDRIHEIGKSDPKLLIAHSYTRYLGDLSGGQILKRIAEKAMGLEDGGVAFYEFPAISDERAFKNQYRAALNALPLSDKETEEIVEEANKAFGMNMYMFKELEGNWIITTARLLFNSVFPKLGKKTTPARTA
eukprot:tig00021234_g19393.t1